MNVACLNIFNEKIYLETNQTLLFFNRSASKDDNYNYNNNYDHNDNNNTGTDNSCCNNHAPAEGAPQEAIQRTNAGQDARPKRTRSRPTRRTQQRLQLLQQRDQPAQQHSTRVRTEDRNSQTTPHWATKTIRRIQ